MSKNHILKGRPASFIGKHHSRSFSKLVILICLCMDLSRALLTPDKKLFPGFDYLQPGQSSCMTVLSAKIVPGSIILLVGVKDP